MASTYIKDLELEIAKKLCFIGAIYPFTRLSTQTSNLLDNRFWKIRFIEDFGLRSLKEADYELLYILFLSSVTNNTSNDRIIILGFIVIDIIIRFETISVDLLTTYMHYNTFLHNFWRHYFFVINMRRKEHEVEDYYKGINRLLSTLLIHKKALAPRHLRESLDAILVVIDIFYRYKHVNKLGKSFGVYYNGLKLLLKHIISILNLSAINEFKNGPAYIRELLGMI